MEAVVRERHPHAIADRRTLLRRQEDADLDLAIFEIDQSVIAEEFDKVDVAVNDIDGVGRACGPEVSGPDAGDDRLRTVEVEAVPIDDERRRIARQPG